MLVLTVTFIKVELNNNKDMKNYIIACFTILFFTSNFQAQSQTKLKTENSKVLNFDNMLHCNDFSYNDGYFLTADYGCIYTPKEANKYGNIAIYLVPKRKTIISDDNIDKENNRVNKLSQNNIKKGFKIYLSLIDKKFLNYTRIADPNYYQKEKYENQVYTYDEKNKKWILLDTISIHNGKEEQKAQTRIQNIISK